MLNMENVDKMCYLFATYPFYFDLQISGSVVNSFILRNLNLNMAISPKLFNI